MSGGSQQFAPARTRRDYRFASLCEPLHQIEIKWFKK
jgi:hypothetical protein